MTPEFKKIPLHLIDEPDVAMRLEMSTEGMDDLMDSLRVIGQQVPINVRVRNERYQIISGHRRFKAAQFLKWDDIFALVFPDGGVDDFAAMVAENVVREDVNAAQEALFYARLLDEYQMDEQKLIATVKRSADYIADRLRLLRGHPRVFDALLNNDINFSVARELNKAKDERTLLTFLDLVKRGGHGARVVARWVAEANSQLPPPTPPPAPAADTAQLAPVEVQRIECFCCGGYKDPGNLEMVYVHRWCKEGMLGALGKATEETRS